MTLSTEQFDQASNHAYECRCELCKQWWADVGPDDDDDDDEPRLCTSCGGSGQDSWEAFLQCPACDGEGTVPE